MFNRKLKAELARKDALLAQYRERIDALEKVEKENDELKLKLRIMEMYCNDEDAILELLEAEKAKFDVRKEIVVTSKNALIQSNNSQLAAIQNAAISNGHANGLAGLSGLAAQGRFF